MEIRKTVPCGHCGGRGEYTARGAMPNRNDPRGDNGSKQPVVSRTCGICGGAGNVSIVLSTAKASEAA